MKKFLPIAALLLASSIPSIVMAQTINIGLVGADDAPEVRAMQQFAAEIESGTEGRIEVIVHPGGALGGDRELVEGVSIGTVGMAVPTTATVANFVPDLQILDIPFLFRDFDHAEAVLTGPIGQEMLEAMPSYGLVGLAFGGMGFRELTNNVRAVASADDVVGLKVRTQQNDLHIAVWSALGALPTPMAFPEVYTALQQGVIDGQENPVHAIVNNGLGEVQQYISMTDHAFAPLVVLISPSIWDGLSDEDKALFRTAAENAMVRNREMVEDGLADNLEALRALGVTVVTDVDKASFRNNLDDLFADFANQFGADRLQAIEATE